jgi:NAD(P)-dependent dehydrogenase (short-subunit alcohol dehydrogenase family)
MSSAVTQKGIANHEAIAAAKAGVTMIGSTTLFDSSSSPLTIADSGVNGLVLSAAATYAPGGVRVNAVAPGAAPTLSFSRIAS